MKVLLFGADGQVGYELQRSLQPLGTVLCCTRKGDAAVDFSKPQSAVDAVNLFAPDVIVNAAAYTAVDRAEAEAAIAHVVNCETPGLIAEAARKTSALLVHYSTDYVFDGHGHDAFVEEAPTNPLNAYGKTKCDGEVAIRQSGCRHLIFRTSWVYGRKGHNFVRTMLNLSQTREELRIVADQVGAPTGAELIADVTAHAVFQARSRSNLDGTYHLTAAGEASWYQLAEFSINQARAMDWPVVTNKILPITSADYPQPARRPANSRLSTEKLTARFGLHLPAWQSGVARVVKELVQR